MSQDPGTQEPAGREPVPPEPLTAEPAQLGVVFHRVRALGQRIESLAERLEHLERPTIGAGLGADGDAQSAGDPEAQDVAPLPEWSWVGLEPNERAERLRELHQWVNWLIETYEIPTGQLPDCWYQHGSMTSDLVALRAGWTATYLNPQAEPDQPSRWHDTLERTLRRIREWDRHGCGRSGSHTPNVSQGPGKAGWAVTSVTGSLG